MLNGAEQWFGGGETMVEWYFKWGDRVQKDWELKINKWIEQIKEWMFC